MTGKKLSAVALVLVVPAMLVMLQMHFATTPTPASALQPVWDVCSADAWVQASPNDKTLKYSPPAPGEVTEAVGVNHGCAESIDFTVKLKPNAAGGPTVAVNYIPNTNTAQIRVEASVVAKSPQAMDAPSVFASTNGWRLLRDLRGLNASLPPGSDAGYNVDLNGRHPFAIRVAEDPRPQDLMHPAKWLQVSVIFYPTPLPA